MPPVQAPVAGGSSLEREEASGGTEGGAGHRFPKAARLLTSQAFRAVTTSGRKSVSSCFLLFALEKPPSGEPAPHRPRVGLTVSRKVGNAVVRNRVKRAIREFFRQRRHRFHPGLDAVVIARPRSGQAAAGVLLRDLEQLFSRLERRDPAR